MRFVIRLLISAAALWAATQVVPGVHYRGDLVYLLAVALVFGVVNALARPLLVLLSCPMLILTLGLFILVINAFVLWMTSALAGKLHLGFHVDGFWAAFLGGLVVSIVSFALSVLMPDPERASSR